MKLDAIIISDAGTDTYSKVRSLRLQVDGRDALIQNIYNYLKNKGKIISPVEGDNQHSWSGGFYGTFRQIY